MTGTAKTRAVTRAIVSHVIVRACQDCGYPRQIGVPCEGCGLADPPVVHELGQQAATYRNPVKRAWWRLVGQPAASRRVRKAARYTPAERS